MYDAADGVLQVERRAPTTAGRTCERGCLRVTIGGARSGIGNGDRSRTETGRRSGHRARLPRTSTQRYRASASRSERSGARRGRTLVITQAAVHWCTLDAGRRPVLVVSRTFADLPTVVVAPITRTLRDIPTALFLDESDGMPVGCVATFDNLLQVPKSLLDSEPITTIPSWRLCEPLNAMADC